MTLPKGLSKKITEREKQQALRQLPVHSDLIDFCSNDYLGFAQSETIYDKTHQFLADYAFKENGVGGSRLLTGNHPLYSLLEQELLVQHQSEAALVFNSGFSANLGFFSCVPQRHDHILYDEHSHASIREGMRLSDAKSIKFKHNDLQHLKDKLIGIQDQDGEIYVVTESVFSMDGDSPDLIMLLEITKQYGAHLVVDEAHAVGVFDRGLVQKAEIQDQVFARIITFGKALGAHGAAVLGSADLKNYLVNFARPFIYTTGLTPHTLATVLNAYTFLDHSMAKLKLLENIKLFKAESHKLGLNFVESNSAIQVCIIPGNEAVKQQAEQLRTHGFNVKPILSPTVPKGAERLRFCLHSYNTPKEIQQVLKLLC